MTGQAAGVATEDGRGRRWSWERRPERTIVRDQTNPANRFKFNRLAFECLIKTCQKQGLTFFDYLGARLRVPDSPLIPPLPDPIRARVTL